MSFRASLALGLLCWVVVLSGCGAMQTQRFMVIPEEGNGYAIVSIRLNGPGVAPGGLFSEIQAYDYIELESLDGSSGRQDSYRLWPWETSAGRELVYVGTLPEGRYRMVTAYASEYRNNVTYSMTVPMHPDLGTFDVLPNVITDLGILVTTPTFTEDGMVSLFGRVPSERKLETYVREYLETTDGEAPLAGVSGWNERIPSDYSVYGVQYARFLPQITGGPLVDSAGRLLMPARMGELILRNPNGEWNRIATGATATLWSISESATGFHATGAFGAAFEIDDIHAGEWRRLPELSPHSDVIDITETRDGYLHATVLDRVVGLNVVRVTHSRTAKRFHTLSHLVVYRLNREDDQWDRINSKRVFTRAMLGDAVKAGDQLILRLRSEDGRNAGIYRVDMQTGDMDLLDEIRPSKEREIAAYDDHSFMIYRKAGLSNRRYVDIVDALTGESGGSREEELLGQIYHRQRPVRLDDGRLVAFGNRAIREDGKRVYHVLEGATVEVDGEQVPYDPTEGTFFVSDNEEEWVPFAIRPRPCPGLKGLVAVEDRIVQLCQFGSAYSIRVGDDEWQEEPSGRLPEQPET